MKHTMQKAPTLWQLVQVWWRIGILSFGGPAAQIALMHREIVDDKGWLTEQQYLNALSFCMLLPGPEAMQLATYSGWRSRGIIGGLIAGGLFVIPGAIIIGLLALVYGLYGQVSVINALFLGVKAAVVIIVIEALLKVAKKALRRKEHWVIALFAFVALFLFQISFPLVIFVAALFGYFYAKKQSTECAKTSNTHPGFRSLQTVLIWLLIWIVPLIAAAWFDPHGLIRDIALFFSKLAVVTFGGAYAVLVYLGQDVVTQYGWLSTAEMMDGLGLAETTPGPLILVTEFVGYLAGYHKAGIGYGLFAAAVTLWATFIPCFMWIFVGAPYIDWISAKPRLKSALAAITAAVVGVILNLSIWFALHVFFNQVTLTTFGPINTWVPELMTFDWRVLLLSLLSAVLLLHFHVNVSIVLIVSALVGWVLV